MTLITEKPKLVTVFGGSGFLGSQVVRTLAKRGYRVRIATRRPALAVHLQPLGAVGQIKAMQTNLRVRWSVDRAVHDADHVINLVGILAESGRQRFDSLQDFGARAVAEAARGARAGLTQISSIGADENSESAYARTKALGEKAALDTVKKAVVIRPSIMFGQDDSFFNRFAEMARFTPALPLIGGGHTRFQPVYVGDVAEAIARSVDGEVRGGRVYELGGPDILTFRECMEEMLRVIERKRLLVPLPWSMAQLMGAVFGRLPGRLITSDQVIQLQTDNVVSAEAEKAGRTLQGLSINPHTLEAILPSYLWKYRKAGQFTRKTYA